MNIILVVDDEASFRENVGEYLESKGYQVLQAADAESATKLVRQHDLKAAIIDVRMPYTDGITLMAAIKQLSPATEIVMVTGHGSIKSAVEAMQQGAFHYVTKPVRLAELELLVSHAVEKSTLVRQNELFREHLRRRQNSALAGIVAHSAIMRELIAKAAQVAQTNMSVLLEGETGTGKEVLAEFIHARSGRKNRSFAVLNCGGLPENLLDAELFGHEKGAFTGAVEARAGMLEIADGGTLLLDEIGDMSSAAQIRLLRFLDRGVIRRVGSTREMALDVRVLAATHHKLELDAEQGRFREDLYHRLMVVRLQLPPLRERPEDILPLARHFLARFSTPVSPPKTLSPAACAALTKYTWPGNVREICHVMEHACFVAQLAQCAQLETEHLNLPASPVQNAELLSLKAASRQHVLTVLARVNGNRGKAAEALGISERHLYRLISDDISVSPTDL